MLSGNSHSHGLLVGVRQVLTHGAITLLAVAIAFSLPVAAKYILFEWWPLVEHDANLLLTTEVALASFLVLVFNVVRLGWDQRHRAASAKLASLVYARNGGGRVARWRERSLLRRLPAARDACILTLTGFDTFIDPASSLRRVLEKAYEVRVMLISPHGEGVRRRVASLPSDVTLLSFHGEIEASIAYLAELRKAGKKVTLKFYASEPFWKIVVLGDHAWVQHCHAGIEVKHQPEYVFALQHRNPREGLFVPFYMHFLNQWSSAEHQEYDFDANELIRRDAAGNEIGRTPLGVPINGAPIDVQSGLRELAPA